MINSVNSINKISNTTIARKELNKPNHAIRVNNETDKVELKNTDKNKKISFSEGAKLIGEGFYNQAKDIVTGIFKHPIKTLATVGATTAGLMMLPLIGIPTAVGGAVMALGFGAIATAKMAVNTGKAIKHTQNGENDKAREDLKNIGKSGVDMALSLPFVPKAIKSVKEFAKYGKIGINQVALNEFKNAKGIVEKFKALNRANTEYARSYDYQALVDKQLAKLDATMAEKAAIKQELLEFNVPQDKIAEVALDKLARHKGYTTKPNLIQKELDGGNLGYYSDRTGEIAIRKNKLSEANSSASTSAPTEGKILRRVENLDTNNYKFIMEDAKTGEMSWGTMPKEIWDNYEIFKQGTQNLSKNGRDLLTVVHEFEHFHQHNLVARRYGIPTNIQDVSKNMHRQIIQERGNLTPNSAEWINAEKYKTAIDNYTSLDPCKYLQNELEVGARTIEAKALNSAEFQRLENVLSQIKDSYATNSSSVIIPAILQAESATS